MVFRLRQPTAAAKKLVLIPVLTMEGHKDYMSSISYFPDGKRNISGSSDKTTRRWDLEAGKEIKEVRDVCEQEVHAVWISRNARWVVTAGGDSGPGTGEFKVCEVETGIIPDSMLLASGAEDKTARVWSLETGTLVAGPFQSIYLVGAVRFSKDSKKLAVKSRWGKYLEVWDVETQKLDVKLWAFESRQLLASFDVMYPRRLILSPDSCQLVYTTRRNNNIYLCNILPEILASIQPVPQVRISALRNLPFADSGALSLNANQSTSEAPSNAQQCLPFHSLTPPPPTNMQPLPDMWKWPYSSPSAADTLFYSRFAATPVTLRLPRTPSLSHTHTVFSACNDEPGNLTPEVMLRDLSKCIAKDGDYPVARGGFGEIWKCTLYIIPRPVKVAVKALQRRRKKSKRIKHELRICAKLKHANILSVYGYTYGFGPFLAIVSPWAENGNLSDYLELEGAALGFVRRFQILRDIIAGLQYLHANSVIHGDFNGPNVLIHGDGTACVADFGLSLMYSEVISASQASWTSTLKGNVRWMAPELLVEREDGSPARPSEQSDIPPFGGIMLQVLTNNAPYHYLQNDAAIIWAI
ncbi:kinase-like domain-containing protein [Suillus subalutaceus]|uniref:kinase-like domain-containing protein n=1 Tax=Suillus subalutaceus TaxID=48586 RepID=UPI001B87A3E6|nr:kinase-like domain-containing protein [Suillus subalutaceus]KAG1873589.1 kinase-like domain-containing protein [Suillus subalutaceus]